MHSQIRHALQNVWQRHCSSLAEALDQSIRDLNNLLRLDEYHRHGHEESALKDTLGPFASSSLDLGALSEVLTQSAGGRSMPEERLKRVQGLLKSLAEIKETCTPVPESPPSADFDDSEAVIHEKAEAHLNRMAEVFRNLRIAQLEIRSKYDAPVHDPIFADFNWRQLSPAELRICPPFVVFASLDSDSGDQLRKMMSLIESRKPIKIAVRRVSLKKAYSPTADPSVPARMALEMLPLAMRGVYFLQSCPAVPDYEKQLFAGLTSPRPGVISYLGQREGEDDAAFQLRAQRAMYSRTFPSIVYDPDLARGYVSCFDLSRNPSPQAEWISLSGPDEAEAPSSSEPVWFTFAEFAAEEPEFAEDFTAPGSEVEASSLTPIREYIDLTRRQRIGKRPCVRIPRDGADSAQLLASQAIVTQMCDQVHLWKSLQEISGMDNPYVNTTRQVLETEFGAQQKALLQSLQEDMEKNQAHRETVAVANAVRKLVSHLTGVDPSEIDLQRVADPS